ncbi:hypothetical protein D3C77_439660 [compost metagenome]
MRILLRIPWIWNREVTRQYHSSIFIEELGAIVKLCGKNICVSLSGFINRLHVFTQLEEIFIGWISQNRCTIIVYERILHHRLCRSIHVQLPSMEVRTVAFIHTFTLR